MDKNELINETLAAISKAEEEGLKEVVIYTTSPEDYINENPHGISSEDLRPEIKEFYHWCLKKYDTVLKVRCVDPFEKEVEFAVVLQENFTTKGILLT
jgi:hypothetical protein